MLVLTTISVANHSYSGEMQLNSVISQDFSLLSHFFQLSFQSSFHLLHYFKVKCQSLIFMVILILVSVFFIEKFHKVAGQLGNDIVFY